VADALGVQDIELPLTPPKVLALLGFDDPPPSPDVQRELDAQFVQSAAASPADGLGGQGAGNAKAAAGSRTGRGKALTAVGTVQLAATPDAVFAVLLDPVALAKVVPGCHALERTAENHYRADVTVGVGMIKARYAAQIVLSELDPPHRLRLTGTGLSSLGTASGSGIVQLEASGTGTRLSYDYEAEVSGKVAAVGSRMLEGAAKIVLRQLFESLGRQASGAPAVSQSLLARLVLWLRRRFGGGS